MQQILSPNKEDEGVWIHQDAWFFLSDLKAGKSIEHQVKKAGNGLYLFVLEGQVKIGDYTLNSRDGIGITEAESIKIETLTGGEFLLMDIPMSV